MKYIIGMGFLFIFGVVNIYPMNLEQYEQYFSNRKKILSEELRSCHFATYTAFANLKTQRHKAKSQLIDLTDVNANYRSLLLQKNHLDNKIAENMHNLSVIQILINPKIEPYLPRK